MYLRFLLSGGLLLWGALLAANSSQPKLAGELSPVRSTGAGLGVAAASEECVTCHQQSTPGVVNDWSNSRHAHVGVSCIDCHAASNSSPMATQHESLIGTDVFVSALVSPPTCARCHAWEQDPLEESGHFQDYLLIIPESTLLKIVKRHEGHAHPELGNAPGENGCMQCHRTQIEPDNTAHLLASAWTNAQAGNTYSERSSGNCSTCHTSTRWTW
jgi:hydroxylamine dehydrogenase